MSFIGAVYLSGPVLGSHSNDWRTRAAGLLKARRFEAIDPIAKLDRRDDHDHTGTTATLTAAVVQSNKDDIASCDAMLVWADPVGEDSAAEALYGWERDVRVVVVAPTGATTPWLSLHCEKVVRTLDEAVRLIAEGSR